MSYKLTKKSEAFHKSKAGIELDAYPNIDNVGVVVGKTEEGHNQEFYHNESTFSYIILDGTAVFYLGDEEVEVTTGDILSIEPNTRIFYKGKIKYVLLTTPPWTEENEVETRAKIW